MKGKLVIRSSRAGFTPYCVVFLIWKMQLVMPAPYSQGVIKPEDFEGRFFSVSEMPWDSNYYLLSYVSYKCLFIMYLYQI